MWEQKFLWTAVPTTLVRTAVSRIYVGTAVPTILVGTAVPTNFAGTMITGIKVSFGGCSNNFCWNSYLN